MLQVHVWAQTDVGKQRSHNEDNFVASLELGLFGVADGMGGHASGEIASRTALESLVEAVRGRIKELRQLVEENAEKHRKKIISLMDSVIQQTARAVYELSQSKASSRGMGTTLSVLLTLGNKALVAHVGDSRVFLLRDNQFTQLTEDHSLVREQLRLGLITEEEAERSPYKNVITRAVGASDSVEPDIMMIDLQPNDRFLVCSDGLHGYFEEPELQTELTEKNLSSIPQRLIDLANHRGGRDNITAVIVSVVEGDSAADANEVGEITNPVDPISAPTPLTAAIAKETTAPPPEEGRTDTTSEELRRTEITLRMDVLQQIPLFEHLSYEELVHVMSITYLKSYQDAEIIFKEGSKGDLFYVLLDGKVGLFCRGRRMESLEPGVHFGETAIVERVPREITAISESKNTQLLTMQRKSLLALLRKNQSLAVKLLWGLMKGVIPQLRDARHRLVQALEDHESSTTP